MNKRLLIALMALLALLVSTTACAAPTATPTNAPTAGPTAAPEYYKIDYYIATTTAVPDVLSEENAVGKVIKDKFNISFNFISYPGSWDEKCALMLAAGDYPEIIQLNTDQILKNYISAGALVKLDSLIPDFGPNFKKFYKESLNLYRLAAEDEGIYFFNPNHEFSRLKYPINDLMVRSDALEAAGWPNLLNEDDYLQFLKESLAKFPTTNGKKTIGLTGCFGESWAPYTFTAPSKGDGVMASFVAIYDHNTKKYSDYMENADAKAEFHFFNTLYREGLLDKESFADKYAQTNAKANEGTPLVVWYTQWMRGEANALFEKAGTQSMEYVAFPMRMKSQEGKPRDVWVSRGGTGYNSISITKNCKEPERVMQVIDYLSTDEGIYLNGWGIEGLTYDVVDNKKVVSEQFKADVNALGMVEARKKYGIGMFDNFLAPGNLGNDAELNPYDLQVSDEYLVTGLTEREKTVLSKYGWTSPQDPWFSNPRQPFKIVSFPETAGVALVPDSELAKSSANITDYTTQNIFKLIMSDSEAKFDAMWEEMTTRRKEMGLQLVLDEMNKLVLTSQARIDALNEKYN